MPLSIFLLLAVAIGGTGYLVYRHQQTLLQDDQQAELLAIADAKVAQIASWLAERRNNATVVAHDPLLARTAAAWFRAGAPAGTEADLLAAHLAGIQQAHGYAALTLLDTDLQVRLSVGGTCAGPELRALSQQALTTGQVRVSDLHRQEPGGPIEMDLLAPLSLITPDHSPPVGVVCFKIDPHRYLFPLIQTWPTPSPSAETLLVRREGDQVVYLNELRHRTHTALQLRLPVASPDLPAAMAARGWAGIFAGVDYRQVNVLAALRPVPDTAWFLIAKIDADEVYAPTRQIAKLVAVLVGLFIGGAGLGVGLWWRQQHARFAAAHQRGELERQALIQHFDYLAKYANDIILLTDAEGKLVEANDRAVAAYGYAREELLQLNLRTLYHPDTWAQLNERIQPLGHTNGLVYETWHLRKDKSRFPVEVSSRLMPVDHQPFVQNIIRDITQRRRTEAALRESEARFRTFMDNNPVLAFIKDETGRYLYGNRAWLTSLGKPVTELIGKTDYELFPADVAAVCRESDAAVYRDAAQPIEQIESTPGPDGQLRWWTVIKFPITSPTGRRLLGGLALDISARKQAEEQARQRQAELAHLSRLSILGEMASGLAHELSQPLTAITNYCDAALHLLRADGEPAETVTQTVERAHRQAQRAGAIILQLHESMHNRLTAQSPVNVNVLIQDTVQLLDAEARLNSIALTLDLADSLPLLRLDQIQIEQVLVNLLHNAIEAMRLTPRARRRLTISTRPPVAGTVQVTVQDTGPGLDDETIQRLFERFQTCNPKGAGLGLSISRSLIEAHGGSLWAEASQAGAIFHFTLPVTEEVTV